MQSQRRDGTAGGFSKVKRFSACSTFSAVARRCFSKGFGSSFIGWLAFFTGIPLASDNIVGILGKQLDFLSRLV
jgi:hypothetical protein